MPSAIDIHIVHPGQDDPAATSVTKWIQGLLADLDRVFDRILPEKPDLTIDVPGKAFQSTAGPLIFIIFTEVSLIRGSYGKWLQSLLDQQKEKIKRIFRIDCSGIQVEDLPAALSDARSIDFLAHGQDLLLKEDEPAYWSKLVDLAAELAPFLPAETESPAPKAPQATGVYLAETGPDTVQSRDKLRRELLESGFRVHPELDLHARLRDLRSYITQLADQSQLAIHLLGNAYGKVHREIGKSITELQVEVISDYLENQEKSDEPGSQALSRLIWLDPDFSPTDSKQEEFVDQLKRNLEHLHRTEIIQTPLELFKTLIINRLNSALSDSRTVPDEFDRKKVVYLIHAPGSSGQAAALAGALEKDQLPVRMLDYGQPQQKLLEMHQSCLRQCAHALILYSDENRFWLRSKIMDLLKAPGLGRTRAMKSMHILAGGEDALEDFAVPSGIQLYRASDPLKALPEVIRNMK